MFPVNEFVSHRENLHRRQMKFSLVSLNIKMHQMLLFIWGFINEDGHTGFRKFGK